MTLGELRFAALGSHDLATIRWPHLHGAWLCELNLAFFKQTHGA